MRRPIVGAGHMDRHPQNDWQGGAGPSDSSPERGGPIEGGVLDLFGDEGEAQRP